MQTIMIEHFLIAPTTMQVEAMAALAGASFPIAERVPEAAGEAFDWHTWYRAWIAKQDLEARDSLPTHLQVEAADTFEASIPWEQLERAALLYALDGKPLAKGGPARLYVPDGTSKCLNVKSVVKIKLVRLQAEGQQEASYGFKHTFSAADLRMNK
jgi:hypothetical protein